MSAACEEHRAYLSALADGETELVPESTISHVRACLDCAAELDAFGLVSDKLRQAAAGGVAPLGLAHRHIDAPGWSTANRGRGRGRTVALLHRATPRRLAIVAGLAAALLVGGVGGALWTNGQAESKDLQTAMAAAAAPAQVQSANPEAIRAWCIRASGRPMPDLAVPGLTTVGARMDRARGHDIVTVAYQTDRGERVFVSWMDTVGSAPAATSVKSEAVEGRLVLMVRATAGTAVVSGNAPLPVLWQAAGTVESKT